MPDEIIVRHEIDLGQLEKFESALREFKDTGSVKEITAELKKQVTEHKKIKTAEKEELGIVGKLIKEQKELRQAQKYAQTEKELNKINKRLREVQVELKKAKNTTAGWATALGSFQFKFNALGNIAANVASTISRTFNRVLRDAVSTVREFESAMAGVRAITGATDEEFRRLEKDAIRLGGATIFTATQVAELQMNYAKLGFSTQEILNATEATLSLAAATDEGLAEAALVAGSTLRAFQMDAIETQRVVDVMAKSFTSSALNLEHWKESMKFAASIAEGAGLSIETTAAAFAVLADAGIKGSIAGTSLKNILLRMSDANSKLSKTVGFAVRNSEDFIRALEILNKRGTDLTEVFELTDRRAAPALRILIEMTEAVRNAKDEFEGAAGAAKEMADIRMDTLKGSITILKSAWEGLILSFESGNGILTKGLRRVVDWITEIILKVKELTLSQDEFMKEQASFDARKMMEEFASGLSKSKDKMRDLNGELGVTTIELMKAQAEFAKYGGESLTNAGIALAEFQKKNKGAGDELWHTLTAHERWWVNLQARLEGVSADTYLINQMFHEQRKEAQGNVLVLQAYVEELQRLRAMYRAVKEEAPSETPEVEMPEMVYFDIDAAEKEAKALIEIQAKTAKAYAETAYEFSRREIILSEKTEEEKTKLLEDAANERNRALLEIERDRLTALLELGGEETDLIVAQIALIDEKLKSIGIDLKKEINPEEGIWAQWYKEVNRVTGFIIDSLQEVNNEEIRVHEERISRIDTELAELQRQVQIEASLMEQGKGNRIRIVQAEMAQLQKEREKALKDKEKAIKKEQRLQLILQAANLATTITDIIQKAQDQGGVWGWLLGLISSAAMIAAYALQVKAMKDEVYGEGGWIDGDPHSRGGKWINAEGGEFVVRKNVAHKYPELLEALNKDDIHSVWNDLNMSLNRENIPIVNMNNAKTEELLTRLVELNEEMPRDIGDGYISFKKDGVVYRVKKNGW